MAYNQFTLHKLKTNFELETQKVAFLTLNLPLFACSQKLLDDLAESEGTPLATEKAKVEYIINLCLQNCVSIIKIVLVCFLVILLMLINRKN
jgi:hypothetical protein